MRVTVYGATGKVGRVLVPALEEKGFTIADRPEEGVDVAVDFTTPEAVVENVTRCLDLGVPMVIGTTGWDTSAIDLAAQQHNVPVLFAPNFALGAVVMMRLSALASRWLPNAHIVEMHDAGKKDIPSGTSLATAAAMANEPSISSVRLPGLVAHQEVLFSARGQILTIRHDSFSRESFVDGVVLAIERVRSLPAGLTVGLEHLLAETSTTGHDLG